MVGARTGLWRRLGVVLLGVLLQCGGAERPGELSTAEVRGGPRVACELDGPRAQPLVVDLPAEERVALEAAMKRGVVAVSYDCERLVVLPECRLSDAAYGFVGVTAKEEQIRLETLEEVQANLPFGTVDVDVSEGRTVDVAMMMVGQLRTPALGKRLEGRCEGATHFVRGATVGAFAMTQGTKAESHAAATILVEAGETRLDRRESTRRDGRVEACRSAKTDDPAPRQDCGALLRIDLEAIGGAEAPKGVPEDFVNVCPRGLVLVGDKCARPNPSEAFRCTYGDTRNCVKQCRAGNVDSCVVLGVMHAHGDGAPKDARRSKELLAGPCRPGDQHRGHVVACGELGLLELGGQVGTPDPAQGQALLDKACRAGRSQSCHHLALLRWHGPPSVRDRPRAQAGFDRGCRAGSLSSCSSLGLSLLVGQGKLRNQKRARATLQRACDAGDDRACAYVAMALFYGLGGPANPSEAALMAQTACDAGEGTGCVYLGLAYDLGRGADADEGRAWELYYLACKLNPDHCAEWGFQQSMTRKGDHWRPFAKACRDPRSRAYGPPDRCPIMEDILAFCDAGVLRSCGVIAGMLHWHYRDVEARPLAARACDDGDVRACRQLEVIDSGRHSWDPAQRR